MHVLPKEKYLEYGLAQLKFKINIIDLLKLKLQKFHSEIDLRKLTIRDFADPDIISLTIS